jgi:hypothetical protein
MENKDDKRACTLREDAGDPESNVTTAGGRLMAEFFFFFFTRERAPCTERVRKKDASTGRSTVLL